MDLGLDGSRALITGGSKGIGFAIAAALAAEGASIGLVARDVAGLAAATGPVTRVADGTGEANAPPHDAAPTRKPPGDEPPRSTERR